MFKNLYKDSCVDSTNKRCLKNLTNVYNVQGVSNANNAIIKVLILFEKVIFLGVWLIAQLKQIYADTSNS